MKNANFTKTTYCVEIGRCTYKAYNYDGMSDDEIIDACDRNNWGGSVTRCSNGYAFVTVYTD